MEYQQDEKFRFWFICIKIYLKKISFLTTSLFQFHLHNLLPSILWIFTLSYHKSYTDIIQYYLPKVFDFSMELCHLKDFLSITFNIVRNNYDNYCILFHYQLWDLIDVFLRKYFFMKMFVVCHYVNEYCYLN